MPRYLAPGAKPVFGATEDTRYRQQGGMDIGGPMMVPGVGMTTSAFEAILGKLLQEKYIESMPKGGLALVKQAFRKGKIPEEAINALEDIRPFASMDEMFEVGGDASTLFEPAPLAIREFHRQGKMMPPGFASGSSAVVRFNPQGERILTLPHEFGHLTHGYSQNVPAHQLVSNMTGSDISRLLEGFGQFSGEHLPAFYPGGTHYYRYNPNELIAEMIAQEIFKASTPRTTIMDVLRDVVR